MKLEDMKNEIKKQIEDKNAKIAALEKVVIKKKKDGSDYKKLSQAIEGGKIIRDYINSSYETVYIDVPYHGASYLTARIPAYGYQRDLPNADERKRDKFKCRSNDTYFFTTDEIKEAIQKEIDNTKKSIIELEEASQIIGAVYKSIIAKAKEIHDELEDIKTLHYELTDTAKKVVEFGYVY